MESNDNNATGSPGPTGTSRRSGRVSKAPVKFVPDAPLAAKRKRSDDNDDDDVENEPPAADDLESDEEADDGADDDDEVEEAPKRKKKPSQSGKSKKPAAKKPKINGDASAADNHAVRMPSRPKKTVRIAIDRRDGDGLFGEIFSSGDSSDDVAALWYQRYQADHSTALTDLVNCILLSAGCDQLVTVDDIQDPENCAARVEDLQNVYAQEGVTDYPLISRNRTTKSFRDLLVSFFRSLINIMHETDVLYKDDHLMENIKRWVASMSSATLRPFRHTATTVALAMMTALVEVAKKLNDRVTKMTQQADTAKAKGGKNKDRLMAVQRNLEEANQDRQLCEDAIRDFFDTVFVHRYRDVDPKIRTECVESLGSWLWLLPSMFMEPEFLRYLGWMLSDTFPQTRQEVLKQLARIFRRDADKLGHFIDRFRERLIEMATKDADISVRVTAVSVIEALKSTGMLEPNEIDSIGKLIFDSELRVRKAVVDFFADCVNDSIESKTEEMGGSDAIDDIFGDDQVDEYYAPRRDWISIKCLAEILAVYDTQFEDEQPTEPPRPLDIAVDMFNAAATETRISMSTQALYEKLEHIRNWEVLAGYLLYDHSTSAKSSSRSKARANDVALRNAVAPLGREEPILLEMLCAAVKLSLSNNMEARKKPRLDTGEAPEDTAVNLATLIPKLLSKFGAEPSTASIVLRLEHYLDLDVFQQLRQDSTTYPRLLDGICTQFNRHVDRGVISEATAALLHARQYEDLTELADSRISVLWENVINSLRNFDKAGELSMRGDLDVQLISELTNILMKMSKLAAVSNCVDVLSAVGQTEESSSPAIEILARTVHRGKLATVDEELDDLEDEAVAYAIKCCHFFFMWKTRGFIVSIQSGASIPAAEVDRFDALRKTYRDNLISTLSSRGINDDLRLFSTGALCDLHILFAGLRTIVEQTPNGAQKYASLADLFEEIDPALVDEDLLEIFDSAERTYAKRAKKTLSGPADDEVPLDDDDLDEVDEEELSQDERRGRELKAEKALCELASKYIIAILARMLDVSGDKPGRLKRRILRNANKLGPNYKDVVSYLDEAKRNAAVSATKKKSHKAKGGKKPAGQSGSVGGKRPLSEEAVNIEDDSDEENPFEEGTAEDLRRRELLDEPPIDDDGGEEEAPPGNGLDDDESVLGD